MSYENVLFFILLLIAIITFISGKLRYDLVGILLLLVSTFLGLVPYKMMFSGFSHSAVITIASIFVISSAVENTGIMDLLADNLKLRKKNIWKQIAVICLVVMVLSAFINNVGAVALMMPVTLKIAQSKNISRRLILMPLSFSSLLGGLTTLIGTPPNIIVSDYRNFAGLGSFSFFAFTPVGLITALAGISFIVFLGWRLIPTNKLKRVKKTRYELFTIELIAKEGSSLIGKKIARMLNEYADKLQLVALVRDDKFIKENLEYYTIKTNDSFIIATDKWTARDLANQFRLSIVTAHKKPFKIEHYLTEIVVIPQSEFQNKTVADVNLEHADQIEIIAISRRGVTLVEKIQNVTLQIGDVLLIKSDQQFTQAKADLYNCLVIETTYLNSFSLINTIKVFTLFSLAIIAVISNLLRVDLAFFSAAIMMLLTGCINLTSAYRSINGPILILVGSLIPIGQAMLNTGTAKFIANGFFLYGHNFPIWISIFTLIVICMLMANVIHTAAVALLFAPIALQIAVNWSASPNPFLMAVAIGASSTFISPIGHQCNLLILGPGNYRFTDFWRMGLPLSVIISIVATIFIMIVWPAY